MMLRRASHWRVYPLTSGYLQLVDAGKLTLDTNMRELFPPLDAAASQIIKDFDEAGKPIMEKNHAPVTLGQMLNQTSGFGMEFGDKVSSWKKVSEKGTGFVNSCKVVRRPSSTALRSAPPPYASAQGALCGRSDSTSPLLCAQLALTPGQPRAHTPLLRSGNRL